MITAMKPGIKSVLWLFPLAFLFHDGEELLTMPAWIDQHQGILLQMIKSYGLPDEILESLTDSHSQTAIAIGFELLLLILVTFWVAQKVQKGWRLYLYTAFLGMFFFHLFVHIGQAILFKGYIPGILTGTFLSLPLSFYIYRRLFQDRLINWTVAISTGVIGGVFLIPAILLARSVGRNLLP
jgi:hypothetical protein